MTASSGVQADTFSVSPQSQFMFVAGALCCMFTLCTLFVFGFYVLYRKLRSRREVSRAISPPYPEVQPIQINTHNNSVEGALLVWDDDRSVLRNAPSAALTIVHSSFVSSFASHGSEKAEEITDGNMEHRASECVVRLEKNEKFVGLSELSNAEHGCQKYSFPKELYNDSRKAFAKLYVRRPSYLVYGKSAYMEHVDENIVPGSGDSCTNMVLKEQEDDEVFNSPIFWEAP